MMKARRRWAGNVARKGRKKYIYGFGWEARRKETRIKPRRRREDDTKMDFREIGWGGMHWIHLAQDSDQWRALANTVMNLRVLQNV
jgi:hypothetical protein